MKKFLHLLRDDSGATAIEYGLILGLVVIGIVASLQVIGTQYVAGPLSKVGSNMR